MKYHSKVAIVDYGAGNLRSVAQALLHVSQGSAIQVLVTSDPQELLKAQRIVLPGQGAMPDCMQALKRSGMQEALLEAVRTKPVMGVCVGMQMMLSSSEEGPTTGLDWVRGCVLRFALEDKVQPDGSRYKVPQMGWNQVLQTRSHPLWLDIPNESYFYFVHSYYVELRDANYALGQTDYGLAFTSALTCDNIFATQFHPEKSAHHGLTLYRNFLNWSP